MQKKNQTENERVTPTHLFCLTRTNGLELRQTQKGTGLLCHTDKQITCHVMNMDRFNQKCNFFWGGEVV